MAEFLASRGITAVVLKVMERHRHLAGFRAAAG
jgi:hypothetical protein